MADAQTYLGLLAEGSSGGPLESAGDNRDRAVRAELVDRLEAEIDYMERLTQRRADPAARAELLDQAGEALARLLSDGVGADLTAREVEGLEAVIVADGSRPALFVNDDYIDLTAPSIGSFMAPLARLEPAVRRVCRGVGRVDDPAAPLGYQGTAWAVADGIVVTNYHVLTAIAPSGVRTGSRFDGRLAPGAAVHFGQEINGGGADRRFPIRRVISVGRDGGAGWAGRAGMDLNFDGLDLAVLELEPVAGRAFPEPIPVARGDDPRTRGALSSKGRYVYLVGYPGGRGVHAPDVFDKLFDGISSVKRLAPGRIMQAPGTVEHDPQGWVFTHDASTLGGNSGSVVVDLESDGQSALGLHFAGSPGRRNWAHATEKITGVLEAVLPAAVR
ncbi:hypothetical protein ACTI_66080 [Actinoplanes sp. OR16]|uniref:trypsin-like serine peptidase n=1 Tax=Actinoplanes sp. OR16 TaxID=946334 RepID=UPI000F71591F|nr:serine protease [Actinoplanes sp. OR16]BBH69923.1 hypothetical protein ACTI_66080 [Actinoplanes sp. OR16]